MSTINSLKSTCPASVTTPIKSSPPRTTPPSSSPSAMYYPPPIQVNADGTINLAKSNIITVSGFVRASGQGDAALQKVLKEKRLI